MLSFKPTLSLSFFTFIKRLFSSSFFPYNKVSSPGFTCKKDSRIGADSFQIGKKKKKAAMYLGILVLNFWTGETRSLAMGL